MRQKTKFTIYNLIKHFFPAYSSRIRQSILRWCGVRIGKNVLISARAEFWGEGYIEIGDSCLISDHCYLVSNGHLIIGKNTQIYQHTILSANGSSTLSIGENCQIAHMVSLKTSTHEISTPTDSEDDVAGGACIAGTSKFEDIVIGAGCWLCAGVIVIPGVKLGRRCIVAAGAVVTRDTPANVLVAGVPAIVKKLYGVKEVVEELC